MRDPNHIQDEWLVLRCQAGEQQAFETLVKRWHGRLLRHACRLTGLQDAATDVLQESWVGIVSGLGKLKDPALFRQWAYQIVTRKAADWVRIQQRQRRQDGGSIEDVELVDQSQGQDDGTAKNDVLARMRRALKQLPEDRRIILSLFYSENMSVSEIAEILAIPAGTVKSRLFHSRQELRQLLEVTP